MNGYREENVTQISSYVEIANNHFCWQNEKGASGSESGHWFGSDRLWDPIYEDIGSQTSFLNDVKERERERGKDGGREERKGELGGWKWSWGAGRPAGGHDVDVVLLDFLTLRTGFNRPRSRSSRCRSTGHIVYHRSSWIERVNSNV